MSLNFILIQFIGFLGTGLFFLSFQCRENKNLFRVQFFSYILYTTHLLLLGATTGGISYLINCFRSFCLASKVKFLNSNKMCVIICILQVAALKLTWGGWISFLPVIANIASTIGGYTKNPQKVRIAGMFVNSPLWIIYNIIVGSWAGILDEIISEASMIISIVRFGWSNLDQIEE
ncbi:MAG: YgjV family protein [Lachnospiraceae bacterium]|nr:YgjV family protein [Lachnospiraceae bacterium]